jgi:hypothetical protein
VQHPSHEISHPGNYDSSGRLAFQYLSDAETPLDAATDETLENMMEGLSTWPVFESREQPDGIASQYVDPARLRATDTTHWGIMEAAWPNFESREQPDGVAYQDPAASQLDTAADTTHLSMMEAAWPDFESREEQSYETPFHYRLGRAETSLDAATDASFNRQDNLLV